MRRKLSLGKAGIVLGAVLYSQLLIGLLFISIAQRSEMNTLRVELGAMQVSLKSLENRIDRQNRKMLQLYDQIDQAMYDANKKLEKHPAYSPCADFCPPIE